MDGATLNGTTVPSSTLALWGAGSQDFTFTKPAATPDTLSLQLSEDNWQGDAQYTVSVNSATIGGVRTATASHSAGATQDVSLSGDWGSNPSVGISFINDAYGGSSSTDRNLYVNSASYDGQTLSGAPVTMYSNGTASLSVPVSTALTLDLAEDAWQGDAQYSLSVDGTPWCRMAP